MLIRIFGSFYEFVEYNRVREPPEKVSRLASNPSVDVM